MGVAISRSDVTKRLAQQTSKRPLLSMSEVAGHLARLVTRLSLFNLSVTPMSRLACKPDAWDVS